MRRVQVQTLCGKVSSHMPQGVAKNKKHEKRSAWDKGALAQVAFEEMQ